MRTTPFRRDDGKFGLGDAEPESVKVTEKSRDTRFKKGQPRPPNAGRKKGTPNGSTQEVMALCEEYDFNPIEAMIVIALDEMKRLDVRVKCMDAVADRMYSKRTHSTLDLSDETRRIAEALVSGRERVAKAKAPEGEGK